MATRRAECDRNNFPAGVVKPCNQNQIHPRLCERYLGYITSELFSSKRSDLSRFPFECYCLMPIAGLAIWRMTRERSLAAAPRRYWQLKGGSADDAAQSIAQVA